MSTNSECAFIERKPGEWFYILEDYHAPKNAWDWREYATAYGPFPTEEAAQQHLFDNHANPGGASITPYQDGYVEDDVAKRLFDEAPKHTRRRR
jgi:hypothetical protein